MRQHECLEYSDCVSVHGRLRGAGAGGRASRLKFKTVVTLAWIAV